MASSTEILALCDMLKQSKLLSSKAMATSDDSSIKAERVEELDTLATKLLLESVYAPDAQYPTPESVRSATRSVLTPSSS